MRNKKLLILICVLLLSLANYPIRAKPTMPAYLETEEEKLLNPLPTNDQEAPPAVEVDKILAQRIEEEVLITISTTGRVEYSVLEMDNPPRIVIDLRNAINILPRQTIQVNYPQLSRIRTSQYKLTPEKVTRIVLDLNLKQSYDLFTDGNFLKVYLRALEEGAPPVVVPQAVAEEKAPPEEIAPPVKEPVAEEKAPPREEVPLEELKEEKEEEQPSEEELSLPQEQEVQVPPSFYQTRRITREEIRYTGEPISFDFNNVNIHDVIRLFADFTGLNFVIDPDVSGRITIVLHDVPWDQALDIILKNNGLGKIYELNVVRIATNQKLAQEAAAERKLKEEIELAEDPITVTWSASYAKAGNLEAIVRKNLSTKGDVIIDERTNTLIITDIPRRVGTITDLIQSLDIPTAQVMIEARIVETTARVLQDLGVKWGFRSVADALHGNTTNFFFPNSYQMQGMAPSTQRMGGAMGGGFGAGMMGGAMPGAAGGGGMLGPESGIGGTPYAVNLPTIEAPNTAVGFTFGSLGGIFAIDAQLELLERQEQARVLSRPKVATLNNIPASIKSGFRIPVTTQMALGMVSTMYQDAALKMTVTPQITADNTIIMELEISNDYPLTGGANPQISTKSATSVVLVPDGGTAVIGGIMQVAESYEQSRTPLLHRIPILGWLFKSRYKSKSNRELLIFVTPKILK
ncbi:MAG: type IV pilus secretin PilQ [Candidatus Aminicenantes bacterium]|nr:type IV pilus secretin PilQ [Candidatus Aminicenantes bacterium]